MSLYHKIILLAFTLLSMSSMAQNSATISSIDDLLRLVDERNLSLKALELGLDVAYKDVDLAKNSRLPDASLSASAGYSSNAWVCDRDFSNGQMFSSPHFANSFALEASMLVFSGGAISNNIKIKEIKTAVAKWDLEERRQQAYFLTISYYLDYCKSINILEVLDKNIDQTRMMISEMYAKSNAGLILENDITRYEVQLQNLLYSRKKEESNARIFLNRIATTLDLHDTISFAPDSILLSPSAPLMTLDNAMHLANAYNPSIMKNLLDIQIIDRSIAVAKSDYYPHIRLYAGDNLNGPITYEIPTLNNNINVWYFGIGLNYNIGSLYKTQKTISKLSASKAQANMRLMALQEDVALNVHDNYIHYLDAFELLKTQETTLRLARENYNMMANRYNSGMVLATDLVDADNLRLSAETQYVNARINIIFNYYKLLYAAKSINHTL